MRARVRAGNGVYGVWREGKEVVLGRSRGRLGRRSSQAGRRETSSPIGSVCGHFPGVRKEEEGD